MKKKRYLFSIALGILIISSAFAKEEKSEDKSKSNLSKIEEKPSQISPEECVCVLYNPMQIPASFDLSIKPSQIEKSKTAEYSESKNNDHSILNNYYVTANFLFMKPLQQQMNFAVENPLIIPDDKNSFSIQNFKWNSAFKIGIGNTFKKNCWDAFIGYTRINSSINDSLKLISTYNQDESSKDLTTFQDKSFLKILSQDITKSWNLDFNVVDINIYRTHSSNKFTFKSLFGLKTGIINQKTSIASQEHFNVPVILSSQITTEIESNSWILGPKIGFDSSLTFNNGFRFFANGATSLFYQKFNKLNLFNLSDDEFEDENISAEYPSNFINSSFEGIVGFGYGTHLYKDNYQVNLAIGYEAQVFLNQNTIKIINFDENIGNLIFHGLDITASLNF